MSGDHNKYASGSGDGQRSGWRKRTIMEMARDCGINFHQAGWPELERFAALVRADEREALENLDWTALMRQGGLVTWGDAAELGDRVVAVLRARGQA